MTQNKLTKKEIKIRYFLIETMKLQAALLNLCSDLKISIIQTDRSIKFKIISGLCGISLLQLKKFNNISFYVDYNEQTITFHKKIYLNNSK
jgi:hypothetical protein